MTAKRLMALIAAIVIGCSIAVPSKADERAYIDVLIQYYAQYYDVPVDLVRRVVQRESTFNPRARNGPYWGLMQILPATARTMGFRGQPQDLLDAETNLIYAVKYLRGAYIVADGNHDRAVQLYARGYYYDARDKGLLEVTGLRPGPASPVAPTPPTQTAAVAAPPTPPARIPQFEAPVAASVVASAVVPEVIAPEAAPSAPVAVALGLLPPQRPVFAQPPAPEPAAASNPALAAIAAADVRPQAVPSEPAHPLGQSILSASAYMGANPETGLRPSLDMFDATFSMLEAMSGGAPAPVLP